MSSSQYPKGTITLLVEGLRKAPELAGYPIHQSARKMALNGAPPRIVIYPTVGSIQNPRDKSKSIRDVERSVVAHLWGHDHDECEYLEQLLVQALLNQGAGGDPLSPANATPGIFWQATEDVWDQTEDANRQGEEVYVVLVARAGLAKTTTRTGVGQVGSITYVPLTATLSSAIGATDTIAPVNSTIGFPSSGLLTIDAEQLLYTGVTPSSFTGLARGVNGTTAASHAQNATVNVS